MTIVTWLMIPLAMVAALGILAFAGPWPDLNDPHLFEADPLTDDGDHRGRHEWLGEGPTVRLGDSRPRHRQE